MLSLLSHLGLTAWLTLLAVRHLTPFDVETWSMKEMALFNACICQFGKHFDKFVPIVSVKLNKIEFTVDLIE